MAERGIILMNLGSPDSTSVKDVRRYLNEFLMDERVIDKPFLMRWLLVKALITPARAPKSAAAYKKIWREEGSPLVVLTQQLCEKLSHQIPYPVEIAMRYGNPHPKKNFEKLLEKNPEMKEVIVVPLYPHYAMSSYETAVEYIKSIHRKEGYAFRLKIVPPFYNHLAYIEALAESIRPYLKEDFDQLLFSYHGIPQHHLDKYDPNNVHAIEDKYCCNETDLTHTYCYRYQVTVTSDLVAARLGLTNTQWQQSYQSRLGRQPWLLPNTQERLPALPGEGVKKLLVVSPSFVSDCLETLEEINMEGRKTFMENGGVSYTYIPCMNVQPVWINALVQLIEETAAQKNAPELNPLQA